MRTSIGVCLLVIAQVAWAARDCPDMEVLGPKMITDICWGCIFPIKLAGANMGSSSGSGAPNGAVTSSVCSCQDALGVYHPGFVTQMWEPYSIMELVRSPACMASLGGAKLELEKRNRGRQGKQVNDRSDSAFYHYHYYSFPLLSMLDLLTLQPCKTDGYLDIDVIGMSEVDPTWNRDELSFFIFAESAAYANPIAKSACVSDGITATTANVNEAMPWCAGAWGTIYPVAGHVIGTTSLARTTGLLGARGMMALHRRGFMRKSLGEDSLCGNRIYPMLPKTQYKMSMFYPKPEATTTHTIGQSTFSWGQNKKVPTKEDANYIIFRWNDCCLVQ